MSDYNRDTLTWGSYDGRETLIKDLDVRHLVNILNHITDSNVEASAEGVSPAYSTRLCQLLETEAEIRIMTGWAANIGIPRQNEDGTWALINQTKAEKVLEDTKTAMHQKAMKDQETKNQRLNPLELIRQSIKIQQLTTAEMCK